MPEIQTEKDNHGKNHLCFSPDDRRSPGSFVCQRVLNEVAAITGWPPERIVLTDELLKSGDANEILVDHISAFERADLDVLYPSREQSLLARGKGTILVPFGDSQSALTVAQIALDIAAAMTLPVVFYHTTWIDQSVHSDKPEEHMCQAARQVAATLRQTAEAVGDKLIVMPRSAKTTMGCYVNQALAKTPLPLLTVAAKIRAADSTATSTARVLLQHSIGGDHEKAIKDRCLAMAGVDDLSSLKKTFQIGSTAVCMATIVTEHSTSTIAQIKYGLEHHLKEYLLAAGFKDCELHLKFQKPEPHRHRIDTASPLPCK
ncbi:MAG: hypothetical protein KGS72_22425 [Cyanobacteria bacterium REEB67]|nr:hypothetical protein [Cyanobacteria bacterium REEB67]